MSLLTHQIEHYTRQRNMVATKLRFGKVNKNKQYIELLEHGYKVRKISID